MYYYRKNIVLVTLLLFGVFFSCSVYAQTLAQKERLQLTEHEADTVPVLKVVELQNAFRQVSKLVLPTVVRIDVRKEVERENGFPFFDFFRDPEKKPLEKKKFYSTGLGSGVIVRKIRHTYYVLTNAHVTSTPEEISVTLNDHREYDAKLVGEDPRRDLALVSFTTKEDDIPVVRLGDSDELQVGDWVLAMGSPFGFQSSVTAGIISALGRTGFDDTIINDFIQTDAAINRGNSGGALVNIQGEVIGINTWISTPTGASSGVGFAIPINRSKKVIDQLIQSGKAEYGWLGVYVGVLDPVIAKDLHLPKEKGALITGVYNNSPAEQGGMLPGDVIIEVNGQVIQTQRQLIKKVAGLFINKISSFKVVRDGKQKKLSVKIGKRLPEDKLSKLPKNSWPGVIVQPLVSELKKQFDIPSGLSGVLVVDSVNGTALGAGLQEKDVILEINGVRIRNLQTFYRQVNSVQKGRSIKVKYWRKGEEIEIQIKRK